MDDAPQNALAELRTLAEDVGFHERIDHAHQAFHVMRGETLLVSFEMGETLWATEVSEALDASLLLINADSATWFRSAAMFDFMDGLTDDGFFDDFDRVLFVGAGMGAYAAGAFSVASPGAQVLLMQPVATLEPERVPWETRNRSARALSWGPRYSYAPRSIIAADHVTVICDPTMPLDAMHASLFQAPHVTQLRMPHAGSQILAMLHGISILTPVCQAAMRGRLTRGRFARLWRARRGYGPYLRALLGKIPTNERPWLTKLLCTYVLARMNAPAFRRKLETARAQLGETDG